MKTVKINCQNKLFSELLYRFPRELSLHGEKSEKKYVGERFIKATKMNFIKKSHYVFCFEKFKSQSCSKVNFFFYFILQHDHGFLFQLFV